MTVAPCRWKVQAILDRRAGRPTRIADLAEALNCSASHLAARFRCATGITLKHYIDEHRARACERLMRFADLPLGVIADNLGFKDVFAFSRFFRRMRGQPPSRWRRDAQVSQ